MSKTHHDKVSLGLWTYLMSDCVLFASLFATFAALRAATAGGPTGADLFDLDFVLIETLVLLSSSFTCGIALLAAREGRTKTVWIGLLMTLSLGVAFLLMEVTEFQHLIAEGAGPSTSAFLSSFFLLVGTHGLHVFGGLVWLLVILAHLAVRGLTHTTVSRIGLFSLFWHFLDIIWIFVFSFVYLLGSL
jgi:cytochrome o ubiquinol oxidase subunit III